VREKIVSGHFCVDRHGMQVELARAGYTFAIDDARERGLDAGSAGADRVPSHSCYHASAVTRN